MRVQIILVILTIAANSFGQESKVINDKFYSASLDREIKVNIYQPANFSLTGDPYRLFIYLHGAAGSVNWDYVGFLKPILDDLISTNQIEPILVAAPVITFKTVHGNAIPYDFHFFADSERNGNYASVISDDLLEWLITTYNVTEKRELRGIGGFSMGAAGCVPIAIRNSDKFIACIAHDGEVPMKSNLIDYPPLLSETGGPPYEYKISKGFFSAIWFGLAAAWSPNMESPNMPEWFIDFPFDENGQIIDSVFTGKMMRNGDPATLLQNPDIYKNDIAIYFDATSYGKPYNDIFHDELTALEIPHTYKVINSEHGIYEETEKAGLIFLDKAMDEAMVKVIHKESYEPESPQLFGNHPNPFNYQTTIRFKLYRSTHTKLIIYNSLGQIIKTLIDEEKSAGEYSLLWGGLDSTGKLCSSGLYVYNLYMDDYAQTRKMLMLK